MRRLAAFLVLLLASCTTPAAPAPAQPEAARCAAGGGCITITMFEMREAMERAARIGAEAALSLLSDEVQRIEGELASCRRGSRS